MDKDQCYIQTLRTLYLHGISLPWGLFIAERSALKRASQWSLKRASQWSLKRASQWSLKQMIILSSSQDISNLVCDNLVITN